MFLYKGFTEITNEKVGRVLHGIFLKDISFLNTWSEWSVLHFNTLVNMYSRFERIKVARHVFDEMPVRDSASWNNMISGYVRTGFYMDAAELFMEMWSRGVELNGFVIASLLSAFGKSNSMVSEGFQIHGLVLKNGLFCDVFVSTSLLHFYGTYGFLPGAQKLLEEMPEKNVVSWTSLMVGYSDVGDDQKVIDLYQRMRNEGVCCNQNTFTKVISSCTALDNKFLGHQVLGHVVKSGFEDNISVANSLVSMFGSFGDVKDSCYVFNHMDERDTISWNSVIAAYVDNMLCEESFRFFELMRHNHGEINSTTLSTLVLVCGTLEALKWGRGIHGLVVKMGLDSNICVCNTLVTMYSDAGRCSDAEHLFHGMKDRDLISWNSMMAGYVSAGRRIDALRLLANLLQLGKMINYVSFTSGLAACSVEELLAEGRIVHALVIIYGLHENLIVGNALVTMYGKCGMMSEAKQVFHKMSERELVTWNALIGGYAENKNTEETLKTFKLMRRWGESANYITVIGVLGACTAPCDLLKRGMPLHAHMVVTGFETEEYVKNSLITMYANCGDLNSSQIIFDELVNKTSATWNAMVAANAHHGYGEEALKLLLEMQRARVDFDEFSLSAALTVSADLASLEEGKQLHNLAIKLGFNSYQYVTNCALDMYGKCGELSDVLKMLPEPNSRTRLSWNILISSFSRHGLFQKARETFHEMLKHGSKPDHVTFVSLLSACSHGGLVDEGLAYFTEMTSVFGVPAGIEHCVCIVDLLGRSGRLADAEAFIATMPVPPNDFVWRSLLAACRKHGNMDLGKKAAEHLLETDPTDDSAYVLYSNVCAASGKWHDVQNIRLKMDTNSIKKKPAYSWVKLRDKVNTFGMGDNSHHPEFDKIYAKLMEIKEKVKAAGYVADTSFALQDTDEEQKEENLWNHSERIALAYGLISTPKGTSVRIFKNLRVCGDCHSVYKLVSSSIVGREIILRDPYRFHHFRDGKCSCGDYW